MRVFFFNTSKLKKNLLLTLLFALSVTFLTTVMIQEPSTLPAAKTGAYAIYKVVTDKKVVALTFDISWGEETHEPIADILKDNNVKVTFFLSGPWAEKHAEFVKRLVKDGHDVQSHGHRHDDFNTLPAEKIKENIMTAHEILKDITGKEPNLIRVPNGAWNETVVKTAQELDYKVIQWSADSLDWMKEKMNAPMIIDRVLKKTHPGAIILMHASDSAPHTPKALPEIIKGLRDKGYEIVTVTELLKEGPGVTD